MKHTIVRQRAYTPPLAGGAIRGAGGGGRGAAGPDDSLQFYDNPGALLTTRGTNGGQVAMVSSEGGVFLSGTQYFKNYLQSAPRSDVDKIDITTGQKSRLFEGTADAYLRDMKCSTTTKLTANQDYAPAFTNAIRKRITMTRPDGFTFVVKLTLPAGAKRSHTAD